MKLNELTPSPGSTKARKRIGRGIGSGSGKTSGKGHKGQKARSGVAVRTFEGGQMPIYRRLPKRGFKNPFAKVYAPLNLDRLQDAVDAGKLDPSQPVNLAALRKAGLISKPLDGIRLLARGELSAPLTIEVDSASKTAAAAVEKAGGKLVLIERKAPPVKTKRAPKPAPAAAAAPAPSESGE